MDRAVHSFSDHGFLMKLCANCARECEICSIKFPKKDIKKGNRSKDISKNLFDNLFDSDRFSEITGLIDIGTTEDSDVIGEKLTCD